MILNIGKENVNTRNSHVLKAGEPSVSKRNTTTLTEVTFSHWCFAHVLCRESLM
jgi:hypothetical protein